MSKNRSRRLRKKLRIEEFQELYFVVRSELKENVSDAAIDDLVYALIDEVIEPRDLAYTGWVSEAFVTRFGRGSVTADDRTAVIDWIQHRPEILSVEASELLDAWYG